MKYGIKIIRIAVTVLYGLIYFVGFTQLIYFGDGLFQLNDQYGKSGVLLWEYVRWYSLSWSNEINIVVFVIMSSCLCLYEKFFQDRRRVWMAVAMFGAFGVAVAACHILILVNIYMHNGITSGKVHSLYYEIDFIYRHVIVYMLAIIPWAVVLLYRMMQKISTRSKQASRMG